MLTNDEKFVWQHLSRCLQVYVIVDYTCIKWLKYACKHVNKVGGGLIFLWYVYIIYINNGKYFCLSRWFWINTWVNVNYDKVLEKQVNYHNKEVHYEHIKPHLHFMVCYEVQNVKLFLQF